MRIVSLLGVGLVFVGCAPAMVYSRTDAPVPSRDAALIAFSHDLATLQELVDSLAGLMYMRPPPASVDVQPMMIPDWEYWVHRLVSAAGRIAAKWKDDPYVTVDGFQVNLALPPSLTVGFRFKEPVPQPAVPR